MSFCDLATTSVYVRLAVSKRPRCQLQAGSWCQNARCVAQSSPPQSLLGQALSWDRPALGICPLLGQALFWDKPALGTSPIDWCKQEDDGKDKYERLASGTVNNSSTPATTSSGKTWPRGRTVMRLPRWSSSMVYFIDGTIAKRFMKPEMQMHDIDEIITFTA